MPVRPRRPASRGRRPSNSLRTLLLFSGVVAATVLAYLPVLTTATGQLWDDAGHLTAPSLRTWDGLWRIWFEVGATQHYYPVTHSGFWLQSMLWGDSLTGYHLVNVLLHAVSACLIVLILRRLAVPGAAFAGLLFALHPVHVESVAWVSELKNTLSGVFFFAAALAYLRFVDRRPPADQPDPPEPLDQPDPASQAPPPDPPPSSDPSNQSNPSALLSYLGATALFVLAVLSKSVTATLPVALLIVLWWRHGSVASPGWRRDAVPLAPWILLGVIGGALTVWFEREGIGAQGADFDFTWIERALIAGRAAWFYAASLAWPADLSFNYPRWSVNQAVWWQYLFPLAAAATLVLLWWRGHRAALTACLCFLVVVAPALGFVNVYPFVFSFVADHFQYHASAALLALAAAGFAALGQRLNLPRATTLVAALAIATSLARTTSAQSRNYVDGATLYRATIAANPDSWLSHNNLATLLMSATPPDLPAAIMHARDALRVKPDYSAARFNLAVSLEELGNYREAAAEYRTLLAQISEDPSIPRRIALIRRRFGNSLLALGQVDEAVAELTRAVDANPEDANAEGDLGLALARAGRPADALPHLLEAVRLEPLAARHHSNLGTLLVALRRFDEAVAALREAVRLEPRLADAYHNLGAAHASLGQFAEAAAAFQEAVRLRPDDERSRAALAEARARIK